MSDFTHMTGIENLAAWMESTNCKRWKMYGSVRERYAGVTPMMEYIDEGNQGVKMCVQKFKDFAKLLNPASDVVYVVRCFKTKADNGRSDGGAETDKNGYEMAFRLKEKQDMVPATVVGSSGREIDLAVENATLKAQIQSMEEKINSILAEEEEPETPSSVTDRVVGYLEPHIPNLIALAMNKLMGGSGPVRPAIGETPETEKNMSENLTDQTTISGQYNPEIFDEVIESLLQHDPNLLQHLKALLRIANEAPEQFKMMVGMLENI